jgi:1,4-alpha-glucan branching enzyme
VTAAARYRAAALAVLLACAACALVTPAQRPGGSRELVLWMPGAVSVQVIGDWNDWGGLTAAGGVPDPSVGVMTTEDGAFWTCPVPRDLGTGWYRYAFLVDGWRWVPDPLSPESARFMDMDVSVLRAGH